MYWQNIMTHFKNGLLATQHVNIFSAAGDPRNGYIYYQAFVKLWEGWCGWCVRFRGTIMAQRTMYRGVHSTSNRVVCAEKPLPSNCWIMQITAYWMALKYLMGIKQSFCHVIHSVSWFMYKWFTIHCENYVRNAQNLRCNCDFIPAIVVGKHTAYCVLKMVQFYGNIMKTLGYSCQWENAYVWKYFLFGYGYCKVFFTVLH